MSPEAQQEPFAERQSASAFPSGFSEQSSQGEQQVLAFKFGGSSLFGAERMLHAANLVRDASLDAQVIVVVSARKGVTHRLLASARSLEAGCHTRAWRRPERRL